MADGNVHDLFRDKHHSFLHSLNLVWVAFDKQQDRLRITVRCNSSLPPEWLKSLSIELFHDSCRLQETAQDLRWTDTEGTLLVVTCARPRTLLPDLDLPCLSSVNLPIGDVMFSTPNQAHEHLLYNEYGPKVMSRLFDDLPSETHS